MERVQLLAPRRTTRPSALALARSHLQLSLFFSAPPPLQMGRSANGISYRVAEPGNE
jgi:hypothetical protein